MRATTLVVLALNGLLPAQGKVLLTRDEALKLVFPKCQVERTTRYLDDKQRARVAKLAGEKSFDRGIVFPYIARKGDKIVGTAYLDSHRVRTARETVMIVVSPTGKVERIEVLAFGEPREYVPRKTWYAQFEGGALDDELRLKRGIKGVTGATLTARATTRCARRILALHSVLAKKPKVTSRPKDKAGESRPTSRSKSRPSRKKTENRVKR